MDVNRQDEGKSAHLCLSFNVDLPASSFLSSSLVTTLPPPPPSPHSLSLSYPFLTKPFGKRRTFSFSNKVSELLDGAPPAPRWLFHYITTVGGVSSWLARQHAGRKKKKNTRGLHAQRWLEKIEVGWPSIECIQKLSDHAVDWFLVWPGLTLRGSWSS